MKRLAALLLSCALIAQPAQADKVTDAIAEQLTTAAYRDDAETMRDLLAGGVDPNLRDPKGSTALTLAIHYGNSRVVQVLLASSKIDVDMPNGANETAIMLAALHADLPLVKRLYKLRAQINRPGWTPLHYAASGTDEGVSDWLLQQGADINARAPNGSTPLMMAAKYGPYDLAPKLLAAGADPKLRNEQGLTAADFAQAAGRDELQKLLHSAER
ncbi:ankyrin repeat domain-containing protein [Burkholderiaceae bacterium UC74_6]